MTEASQKARWVWLWFEPSVELPVEFWLPLLYSLVEDLSMQLEGTPLVRLWRRIPVVWMLMQWMV